MSQGDVLTSKQSAGLVDDELVGLAAPARGARVAVLTSIAFACVAALGTLLLLRADLAYFFAPRAPAELGEAAALAPATLDSNRYVHVLGTPMLSRAVRAEQRFGSEQIVVFPLAGQRAIFVQVPTSALVDAHEGARREWTGRLVRFGDLAGRFSSVRSALRTELSTAVSSETYLLIADDAPGSNPTVLLVTAFCALIIVVNAIFAWRAFRPLPVDA